METEMQIIIIRDNTFTCPSCRKKKPNQRGIQEVIFQASEGRKVSPKVWITGKYREFLMRYEKQNKLNFGYSFL